MRQPTSSIRKYQLLFLALVLVAVTHVRLRAVTITVCASGCEYNNAQLQAAIDAAVAGDTILLQEGYTYTGTYTLKVKTGAGAGAITTIRTGVDATGNIQPTSRYPAANYRICPQGYSSDWYDCSTRNPTDMSRIAKLQPTSNDQPALTTADTAGGTPVSYWTVQWLEFVANTYGGGAVVTLVNDTIDMATGTSAMMPHHIVFDQVVIRGLPVTGQYRGLIADTKEFTLQNSHIYDIKAVGEGQAIWFNGAGPYTVTNNYVSGGTETFFTGGAGTRPEPELTVLASPAPTATSVAVSGPLTDIYVGKNVAFHLGQVAVTSTSIATDSVVTTATAHNFQVGWFVDFDSVTGCSTPDYSSINSMYAYPRVVSVQSATQFTVQTNCTTAGSGGTVRAYFNVPITAVTGNVLTLGETLPFVPVAGDIINSGIVINGITTRYNIFTHPQTWFDTPRIVALPTGTNAVASTTGGTLAAGTYAYRVLARHRTAQNTWADSGAATEDSVTTTGSTSSVTVTWNAVTNAEQYIVYGRTPGGQTMSWTVLAPTTSFVDTGTAGTAGTVDTSASRWQLKNTWELKQGINIVTEYNIIEQSWFQGQSGPCVLFTPSMQNNDNHSATIKNVTFRYNEVRHCNQSIQIAGTDALPDESARTENINISHNLFWDLGGNYGSGGTGTTTNIMLTVGGSPRQYPNRQTKDLTINHNTFGMETAYHSAIYIAGCHRDMGSNVESDLVNAQIKNNIFYAGTYGIASEDPAGACGQTVGRVSPAMDATSVFSHNVLAGAASCALYTDDDPDTWCPTVADLEGNTFSGAINTNRLNYAVRNTSAHYAGGVLDADDNLSLGADIGAINTAMTITESGNNSGQAPSPLGITTSTPLPTAYTGQAYSVQLAASGGTPPYTWALTSGTPPTGLTFNAGTATLSGTPTVAVTNRALTFRVTDAAATQVSKVLYITVIRSSNRASRYNWSEGGFFVRAAAPSNPGDQVRIGDIWFDTTSGALNKATSLGPPISWVNVDTDTVGGGTGTALAHHITFFSGDSSGTAWANVPIGGGEFPGNTRHRVRTSLVGATSCALTAYFSDPAIATTSLRVEYYNGTAWVSTGISVVVGAAGGAKEGAYQALDAGALVPDPVTLRLTLTDGDAADDVSIVTANMVCK